MRTKHTTYIKTMKVIDSCETPEQLHNAHRYFRLALKSMDRISAMCAYDQLKHKSKETSMIRKFNESRREK